MARDSYVPPVFLRLNVGNYVMKQTGLIVVAFRASAFTSSLLLIGATVLTIIEHSGGVFYVFGSGVVVSFLTNLVIIFASVEGIRGYQRIDWT